MAESKQKPDISELLLPHEEVHLNFRASMKYNIDLSEMGGGYDGTVFENVLSKYNNCVVTDQRLIFIGDKGETKSIDIDSVTSIESQYESKNSAFLDSVSTNVDHPSIPIIVGGVVSIISGLIFIPKDIFLSFILITGGLFIIAIKSDSDARSIPIEKIFLSINDEPQIEMTVPLESQEKAGQKLNSILSE